MMKTDTFLLSMWLALLILAGCSFDSKPKTESVATTNMYLFLFTSQGTNGTFTGNYREKLTRVTANDFDQVQNLLSAQDTNRIWRVFNVLRFDE